MNDTIEQFTRGKIKEGLKLLPEDWQFLFKRMYSHKNLEADIDDIVDNMLSAKLDCALSQVERSITKIQNK